MAGQSRVYIVFVGPGYDTARLHVNRSVIGPDGVRIPRSFVSNDDVLAQLQAALPSVEFVRRDLDTRPEGYARLLAEIAQLKDTIDGLIMVGGATHTMQGIGPGGQQPLVNTGLPTIYVDNLFKLQPMSYKAMKEHGKVVLAELVWLVGYYSMLALALAVFEPPLGTDADVARGDRAARP